MSNSTSYDKALLDEAPEVTREQRQRFYDTDLLQDDPSNQRTTGVADLAGGAAVGRSNTDLEAGHGGQLASKEYTPLPPPPIGTKTPWYKTRKGIIGLVVLAIVIIGAVVGGAVGGTQANKSDDDNEITSSGVTNGGESASQLPPNISPSSSSSLVVFGAPATTTAPGETSGAAPVGTGDATSVDPDAPVSNPAPTTEPENGVAIAADEIGVGV